MVVFKKTRGNGFEPDEVTYSMVLNCLQGRKVGESKGVVQVFVK